MSPCLPQPHRSTHRGTVWTPAGAAAVPKATSPENTAGPDARQEVPSPKHSRTGIPPWGPLLGLLGLLALIATALPAQAQTYRFALMGDTPYSDYERQELPKLLTAVAATQPAFLIHVGDIKSSNESCADPLLTARRDLLDAYSGALIYTPGDNEWTDCRKLTAGHFDPEERLNKLRQLFFPVPRSLGRQPLALARQSAAYQENLRWRLGPVLFITLNLPGPDNHYGPGPEPSPEYEAREGANRAWLTEAFRIAQEGHLAGLVIATQADPALEDFARGMGHRGFKALLTQLQDATEHFPGQVVLAHGDTHVMRIDHPLRYREGPRRGQPLANFTRVETYGSPFMGWIAGQIDSRDPALFHFAAHPWPKVPLLP